MLEQNYRSTQTILTAANAVIAQNKGRKPKNLWSDAGDGEQIVGYVADDEHDEAQFVAEEIDRLTDDDGASAGDVAVFYRTNAQCRVFEEVFIRVGLPYKVVGGVRFYERREVRDALAYLRMLVNPADEISLRRILNIPKRGIGERAEACVEVLAQRDRIIVLGGAAPGRGAPGIATRSLKEIERVRRDDRGAPDHGRGRRAARRDARGGADEVAATSPSSRSPTTRRTRPAWRTSVSSWRWRASSPTSGGRAVRRPADVEAATVAPGLRLPRAGRAGGRLRPDPRRRRDEPAAWSR